MLSPSSNSAAGMVMREAMLLRQFGSAYPPPEAEIQRFFSETPKAELTKLFAPPSTSRSPATGWTSSSLRQGSFFTAGGKPRCPAPATATARRAS